MVDVHIPITDGRELVMPRYTEPELQQQMFLDQLKLTLPSQPPPRIRSGEVLLPQRKAASVPVLLPNAESAPESSQAPALARTPEAQPAPEISPPPHAAFASNL